MNPEPSLWVFEIHGGTPHTVKVDGNPSFYHDGGTTAVSLWIPQREVELLKSFLRDKFGSKVEASTVERTVKPKLLGLTEVFVKHPECLTCPWYDPVSLGEGNTCGLLEAPREVVETALEYSEIHREKASSCPSGEKYAAVLLAQTPKN